MPQPLLTPTPRVSRLISPEECWQAMSRRAVPRASRRSLPRSSSSGGAFTPSSLPGLDWWWDPRDAASLTLSGSQITIIKDKSNNAFNSTGGGGANNPTKVTGGSGINGATAINFLDSSSQWFDLPNRFGGFTAYEIHAVRKVPVDTPVGANPFWQFGSSAASCYNPFTDRHAFDDFGQTARTDCGQPAANVWSAPHLYSVIMTATEWTVLVNLVQLFTTATPTSPGWTASPRFGAAGGLSAFWLGAIGEVVGCTSKLSGANRTSLYAYLKSTWGLP